MMRRKLALGLAMLVAAAALPLTLAIAQAPTPPRGVSRGQMANIEVQLRVEAGRIAGMEITHNETASFIERHLTAFPASVTQHQNFSRYIADGAAGATASKWGLAAAGQDAARNVPGLTMPWPRIFSATGEQPEATGEGRFVVVFVSVDQNGRVLDGSAIHRTGPARSALGDFFATTAMPLVVRQGSFDINVLRPAFETARAAAAANVRPLFTDEALAAFVAAGNAAVAKSRQ